MTSTPHTEGASNEVPSFASLGISTDILAVLDKNGFKIPTLIQHKVIPVGLSGKDVIGIAQTGTGKTLGFGIPMLERIRGNKGRGLVVLPTRELALQVDETLRKIGGTLGLQTTVLIGGDSMSRQQRDLRRDPHVIVATPGRLIDHLKQGTMKLDRVNVLVLDEADHMFDIGFAPQIREILKRVPKERQTMLFSATMPSEIASLAMEHMTLPLRIEVAPAGSASEKIEQEIIVVQRQSKFALLIKLLGEHTGPVLVFTRTKHGAKDIANDLRNVGVSAAEIHSNRSLAQRRQALDGFKRGTYRVLAATDIAARGIDVKDIALVVNYDLPEQSEDYVHRIGRTGRGMSHGKAISFALPNQKFEITAIERLMKKVIPVKSHEGATMSSSSFGGGRPSRSFGRRPSGGGGGYRGGSSRPSYGRSSYSSSRTGSPSAPSSRFSRTSGEFRGRSSGSRSASSQGSASYSSSRPSSSGSSSSNYRRVVRKLR